MQSTSSTGFSILDQALTHASVLYPNPSTFILYETAMSEDKPAQKVNSQKAQDLRSKLQRLKESQSKRKSLLRPPSSRIPTKAT